MIPAPPPPPPPPPPALSQSSNATRSHITALPVKNNDRAKLLGEIQAGLKLRKTVTNDRSAPLIGGKISSPSSSETTDNTANFGGSKIAAPGMVAGLFANGIPRKPSDNKRNQANITKNTKTSPPLLPKPSEMRPTKSVIHSESLKRQHTAPVIKNVENVGGQRQICGTIADRLEQFNQMNRPMLAPPTPPSYKDKPTVKDMSPSVKKISIPEQFKTMRPNRTANDTPSLRRSGSSDDVRNSPAMSEKRTTPPPLPANPPNLSRIAKPACPPPPPPIQPPRFGRSNTAGNPGASHFNPISSATTPTFAAIDDDSPPPPPPPRRITSCTDQMDRFTFIPINELPPPGIFSGVKKIYECHPPRRMQNVPAYRQF